MNEELEPPGELSPLTAALGEAGRSPTDAAKASIYRQLLDAVLLAPLDPREHGRARRAARGAQPDGRLELPAFSCRRAFRLWGAVPDASRRRARPSSSRPRCSRASSASCSIPPGPVRVTLGSWEVRRIAAGTVARAVHGSPDRDPRTPLGLPDPPLPEAFADALCGARSSAGR